MSHRWDCPDEYEARERARRDASFDQEYGWGRRYGSPYECDEASDHYRRAYEREFSYREEQADEERRAERMRQARLEEEAYYEQLYAEQAAMEADERAYWAEQELVQAEGRSAQ